MTSHGPRWQRRRVRRLPAVVALGLTAGLALTAVGAGVSDASPAHGARKPTSSTVTPIKHLVVLYDENVSLDHYFGTYPNATNTDGSKFTAKKGTPKVVNLTAKAPGGGTYLSNNPNGAEPQRLDPTKPEDVLTCDQDHDYTPEQDAFDNGKMDKFPASVGTASGTSDSGRTCAADDDLDYYDGNTVTAEWNYAQHFAMSDEAYGTVFGPSTPGALDVTSGSTGNVALTAGDPTVDTTAGNPTNADLVANGKGGQTLISDVNPYYDDCSSGAEVSLKGENVGNLLNKKGLSWGWFEGGFTPSTPYSGSLSKPADYNPTTVTGRAVCGTNHDIGAAIGGTGQYGTEADYVEHHEPFQYYASTANPHHIAPKSLSVVGTDTQTYTKGQPDFNTANHQYDLNIFNDLLGSIDAGRLSPSHLPAVTYLKAPAYEDGHAGYSDPLDEQVFLANEINAIEQSPDWKSTAIVITYDDSDGWYDQAIAPTNNSSKTVADTLNGTDVCGNTKVKPIDDEEGRCGPGPRLPFIVISPWAKSNYVSSTEIEQSSVVKFIEQNWRLGTIPDSADKISGSIDNMFNFSKTGGHTPPVYLSPTTGKVINSHQVLNVARHSANLTSVPVSGSGSGSASGDAWTIGAAAGGLLAVGAGGLALRRRRLAAS
jgi:phospholipase C